MKKLFIECFAESSEHEFELELEEVRRLMGDGFTSGHNSTEIECEGGTYKAGYSFHIIEINPDPQTVWNASSPVQEGADFDPDKDFDELD